VTGFSFPYVSAEGAGEYFEVSFAEIAEGEKSEECGHGNFPIDANLKITMADSSNVECSDRRLCGHFRIGGRNFRWVCCVSKLPIKDSSIRSAPLPEKTVRL
jgi:hypothetical protein